MSLTFKPFEMAQMMISFLGFYGPVWSGVEGHDIAPPVSGWKDTKTGLSFQARNPEDSQIL